MTNGSGGESEQRAHSGPVHCIAACSERVWTSGGSGAAACLREWSAQGALHNNVELAQDGEGCRSPPQWTPSRWVAASALAARHTSAQHHRCDSAGVRGDRQRCDKRDRRSSLLQQHMGVCMIGVLTWTTCGIAGPAKCMQLVTTAAVREPPQSGLVLPDSVLTHTIDEVQLLTGEMPSLQSGSRCPS